MRTIWKSKGSRIWLIVTCLVLVLMIAVNLVATKMLLVSKTLDQVFGGPVAKATGNGQLLYTTSSATDGLEYYEVGSGILEKQDALKAANALNVKICEEGFRLLCCVVETESDRLIKIYVVFLSFIPYMREVTFPFLVS